MCSLTQYQEALPSPTSIQQNPLPTYTAAEVQFHTPTSPHVTTVTVLPSCGSESGQSGSKQGSAADILVAGTAVLVVGVVLMVSAIVLCATVAVIRKRMCA